MGIPGCEPVDLNAVREPKVRERKKGAGKGEAEGKADELEEWLINGIRQFIEDLGGRTDIGQINEEFNRELSAEQLEKHFSIDASIGDTKIVSNIRPAETDDVNIGNETGGDEALDNEAL